MDSEIDSFVPFKRYSTAWKLLGLNTSCNKYLCGLYDVLLNIFVTFCYPTHVLIGVLNSKTPEEIFSNLSVNVACIACSLKYVVFRPKLYKLQELIDIFKELDSHVNRTDERNYFRREVVTAAQRLITVYSRFYMWISVGSLLMIFAYDERRLPQTAWFPFDWRASDINYICAVSYQFVSLSVAVLQAFAMDAYGPLTMCMCAGHVRLLAMRVSKIGYDKKFKFEMHLRELTVCVKDYNKLMRAWKNIEETITWGVFIQLITTALNVCVGVIYVAFYAENFLFAAYYTFLAMASLWELFPCCYYGSLLQSEFRELPYAIFSCNWLNQQRVFRQNLIIFVQLSLKEITLNAGNMFRIHLDSFFATCRMAYSLFACIIRMR